MKKKYQTSFSYRTGFFLYRSLVSVFFKIGGIKILKRKYKNDISERIGIFNDEIKFPKNCIWIHAVSVGEVQSASSLIRRIKTRNNIPCVISTVTSTGHDMAINLLEGIVDKIIYSPWDERNFVKKSIDKINPLIYITMETELWPEILFQLKSRDIPIFLANGRISEESFKKYKRMSSFWIGVLSCFTKLMVRFEDDKEKFMNLGVSEEKIIITGDCKVDTLLDRKKNTSGEKWEWLKNKNEPLFVAGSTHQGEDDVVISAFRIIRKKYPNSKLVIVPRHPERALMSVASALPYPELHTELLSHLKKNNSQEFNVIIVDKIGILFELYAAADAVFVGGSLVQKGGQNPFEPALFGLPAIHGPSMTDFPDTERMNQMGAAFCVHNDSELAKAWENAIEKDSREKAKLDCEKYFDTLGGAAEKTWDSIESYLNSEKKFLKK